MEHGKGKDKRRTEGWGRQREGRENKIDILYIHMYIKGFHSPNKSPFVSNSPVFQTVSST